MTLGSVTGNAVGNNPPPGIQRTEGARNLAAIANGNPDARGGGVGRSIENMIPQSVRNFFNNVMPKTVFGDPARRAEHYTKPISNMPANANFLVDQMTSSQYFEQLKGKVLGDPELPIHADIAHERQALEDNPGREVDWAFNRLLSGLSAEEARPATKEEVLGDSGHPLHEKLNGLISEERDKLAFENVLSRETETVDTQQVEEDAYAKLSSLIEEAQATIESVGADKFVTGDEDPVEARGERRADVVQGTLLEEHDVDLGTIRDNDDHPLRPIFDMLVAEQKEIQVLEEMVQQHDEAKGQADVATRKILAEGASSQRNHQLDYVRRDVISYVGRKLSEFMKKEGLPFDRLLESKTNKFVEKNNLEAGTTFEDLTNEHKVQVYQSIIESSSKANPNLIEKFMNKVWSNTFGVGH